MAFRQDLESRLSNLGEVASEELRCPVSYEVYQDPILLPCGHNLDQSCVDLGYRACLFHCEAPVGDPIEHASRDSLLQKRIRDAKVDEKLDWSDAHASDAEILLFVLDKSSSMGWSDNWFPALFGLKSSESRFGIAKRFVYTLCRELFQAEKTMDIPEHVKVELMTFGSDVSEVKDIVDSEGLIQTLRGINADDEHTALFDALYKAVQVVQTYPNAKFRIIVLTDGGETGHSDPRKKERLEAELKQFAGIGSHWWERALKNVMLCCVGSGYGQGQGKKFTDKHGMEFMALTVDNVVAKSQQVKDGFLKGLYGEPMVVSQKVLDKLSSLPAPQAKVAVSGEGGEVAKVEIAG